MQVMLNAMEKCKGVEDSADCALNAVVGEDFLGRRFEPRLTDTWEKSIRNNKCKDPEARATRAT